MSCPVNKESTDKLKQFIELCKVNPNILHIPELSFFKEYIESLGGKIPELTKMQESESEKVEETEEARNAESEPESDLELDTSGCVEPDKLDDNQKMGDSAKEVSEKEEDKADEKRREAVSQFSEGNFEKAIELYTEAIELNPHSALFFAKRGQAYLKLTKPNACIKDCTRALEINPDSAQAYKFRGRAYRLLGEWELAARDLRQACNIDLDEQTDEWLKEVTPNAKRIEEHNLKKERRRKEKEEKEKMERIRKAREAHAKASGRSAEAPKTEMPNAGATSGSGGIPGMGDFYKLLQDPEVMSAFQDPEVAAAFQDISTNPSNFLKYQSNPKIMAFISKISSKFSGMGFPAGFPGGAGADAGMGGQPPQPPKTDDDNLD